MVEVKTSPKAKAEVPPSQTKEAAKSTAPVAGRRDQGGPEMARGGSPFAMIRRFAEEMDRLIEDFGVGQGLQLPALLTRGHELLRRETGLVEADWSPQVDVKEQDGQFLVRADLPGMNKEDIKVELTTNLLTIQGERKKEKKEDHEGYSYSECSYGHFYRAIPLPHGTETSKVTAEFQNGVLEITIPMPSHPEPQTHRVEVKEKK